MKKKSNLKKINPFLEYRKGDLYLEDINLRELAQEEGTPLYVYSYQELLRNLGAFGTLGERVKKLRLCFSVKANSNLKLLNVIANNSWGADVVSGGELYKALKAGFPPSKIVFSGVCKTCDELTYAIKKNIFMINVESQFELEKINEIAKQENKLVPISFRINPNIDAKTHPYITTGLKNNKFGIEESKAFELIRKVNEYKHVQLLGLSLHIGSQITDLKIFSTVIDRIFDICDNISFKFKYLNLGGGLGISYCGERVPSIDDYVNLIANKFNNNEFELILEPGRSIIASAGLCLGQLHYIKENSGRVFYISDVGMNDFIRPALYQAEHAIFSCKETQKKKKVQIVGPICESSDIITPMRSLPLMELGEYFTILSTGAYGFAMSSNYNSRGRSAEILLHKDKKQIIRKRESLAELISEEV